MCVLALSAKPSVERNPEAIRLALGLVPQELSLLLLGSSELFPKPS